VAGDVYGGVAGAGAPEGSTEAQQQQTALQVMDFLVTKAKADKQ